MITVNTKSSSKPKADTKTALLQAGLDIMAEKGYSNTGIQEVLGSLSIPKGSFYHYFDSKEDFALHIIRHVDEMRSACLQKTLSNTAQTPLQRLRTAADNEKNNFLTGECRKGCLIGNLSQEMSDQSEALRLELSACMNKRRDMIADCVAEAQNLGEISKEFTALEYADMYESGWSGAVMRAKTAKTIESLEIFIDLMFSHFLKP